jgi:hypothetical protein
VNRIPIVAVFLFSTVFASAKDKKKVILPADILRAETVLVVIDPDAGVSPDAPLANKTAQEDVEKALIKWGRFRLANDLSTADLVITVRKGSGKIVQPTIGGVPINDRPVIFEPTDSGGRVGGSHGLRPWLGIQPVRNTPTHIRRLKLGRYKRTCSSSIAATVTVAAIHWILRQSGVIRQKTRCDHQACQPSKNSKS